MRRGAVVRGGAVPKSPRLTPSPGPMNKYVTHAVNGDKPITEKQQGAKNSQTEGKE